jgi:hypothetical protein
MLIMYLIRHPINGRRMKTLKSGARLKTRRIQIAHEAEKMETMIRKAAAPDLRSKRLN